MRTKIRTSISNYPTISRDTNGRPMCPLVIFSYFLVETLWNADLYIQNYPITVILSGASDLIIY